MARGAYHLYWCINIIQTTKYIGITGKRGSGRETFAWLLGKTLQLSNKITYTEYQDLFKQWTDDVKKSKSSKSKFSRRQTLLKNWIDRRIKTEDEKKDYPQNFFVRSNRNAKIKTLHKMIPYRRGALKKSKREKEKTVMNKILGKEEVTAVK